jgi:phage terminase small subunit
VRHLDPTLRDLVKGSTLMPGRKPKPTHLKLLEGNPGKRGIAKELRDQFKAQVADGALKASVGPPPRGSSPSVRATWNRVVKHAVWLDASHRDLLEAYCRAVELMRENPERFRIASTAIRSLGSELGLSPVARVRLGAIIPTPKRASDLPAELNDGPKRPAGS